MADPFSSLTQTLATVRQLPFQRNPWLVAGQQAPVAVTPYGQAAEAITKGLLTGYGFNQAADESAQLMNQYQQAANSGNFNALLQNPDLADAGVALIEQNRLQDQEQARTLQRMFAQQGLMVGENGAQPIPGFNEALIARKQQEAIAERQAMFAQLPSQGTQAPAPTPDVQQTDPLSSLAGEPLEQKIQRTAMELMAKGAATPSQAYQTAREVVKGELAVNANAYKDEIQMREEARNLRDLAEKAKGATKFAGYTGPGGGLVGLGVRGLSAMGVSSLTDEAQGYAMLGEILPELIAAKRPPGAFTEREWEYIRQAGPSTSNLRSQNQVLSGILDRGASLAEGRVDFLSEMRDRGVDRNKAERAWDQYRNSFSLYQETPEGVQVVDPPSWRQFFSDPANLRPGREAATSPAAMGAQGATPAPGYTVDQLQAAGYSPQDIQALQQQGMVR